MYIGIEFSLLEILWKFLTVTWTFRPLTSALKSYKIQIETRQLSHSFGEVTWLK